MRGLVDVGAILPESRRADAGKRERQRNLANKSVHILEEVARIQSAMAIIKNEIRRRRAGDNSEQSAVPFCRSKPEDRHLCVAGMFCISPLTFLRQRHPSGHIDVIARTSNHRDQTSRSRWLK